MPRRQRLTKGHHKAMAYADLPAFMARLSETPVAAAKALMFTILTCARTSEVLHMTWDEIDFQTATWVVPSSRMKMQKEHSVPLSDAALAILGAQEAKRGKNPTSFPATLRALPCRFCAPSDPLDRLCRQRHAALTRLTH